MRKATLRRRGGTGERSLPKAGEITRRRLLAASSALMGSSWLARRATAATVSFGLTPVFLDSDIQLLGALQSYLSGRLGVPVTLVKRRTYQEITAMLLSEQLDAAWICGFPLIQHPDELVPIAVPVWQGQAALSLLPNRRRQ
jgi:phosphonate transport system substrate-binding protein